MLRPHQWLIVVVLASPCCAQLQSLGFAPGLYPQSFASGVTGDGSLVVGTSGHPAVLGQAAVTWSAANGLTALPHLPGSGNPVYSSANAVSGDGRRVVGDSRGTATLWTDGQPMAIAGGFGGATAITPDGVVVAGHHEGRAFRWTAQNGMEYLSGLDPSRVSHASAISADGSVIVGQIGSEGFPNYSAFRWTAATGPVFLPNQTTSADASADASILYGDMPGQAYRWTIGGGLQPLGMFGVLPTRAKACTADGGTMVGLADNALGGIAMIWDAAHGFRTMDSFLMANGVDTSGWTLAAGTGISDDGRTICGYGTDPQGSNAGWIATIPEPGTAGVAACWMWVSHRRRRRRPGVAAPPKELAV